MNTGIVVAATAIVILVIALIVITVFTTGISVVSSAIDSLFGWTSISVNKEIELEVLDTPIDIGI